jgi:hypothetical protein
MCGVVDPADRPRLREDVAIRHLDGEYLAYDPVSDRTVLLNASAAATLELCDGSRTPEEIACDVEEAFGSPAFFRSEDVALVLRALEQQGLLEPPPRGASP